jgi:hypothetical protein
MKAARGSSVSPGKRSHWAAAPIIVLAVAAPAHAQDALVEEADAGVGVERFEYVSAGQTVDLGADRRMIVSYLRSCWREKIRGGTVTIGRETSAVAGGTLERERVKCSGSALRLGPDEGQHSAVMVFRSPARLSREATRSFGREIRVRNVLFGASPIVELPGGGRVRFERLDADGEDVAVDVPRGPAGASRVDFAADGRALVPGALYRAHWGPPSHPRSLLFAVYGSAGPGAAAALGRLLRLPPH